MGEVNLRGENGFHLVLSVDGYEQEPRGEPHDDNWLRGTASVEVLQPPLATFRAKCDLCWQTTDLLHFQGALRTLIDDLTGVATLSTLEDQVEVTVRLTGGKGTIEGRVEAHTIASVTFEAMTDQTFLSETLTELREVTTTYPFRD